VFTEPAAGLTPWLQLLARARTGVALNAYLLTDRSWLAALAAVGARHVPIRVLLDRTPYGDPGASAQETAALAAIPDLTWRWAPARFPFDHAKYLVINPGTPQAAAIVTSANASAAAVDGAHAEDGVILTGPPAHAVAQVFQADWTGHPAGSAPRRWLVLSPGTLPAWLALLRAPGPVALMTEEIGSVPALQAAVAAHGSQARLLVPPLAGADAARAAALAAAGVQIRILRTPYPHGKLVWAGGQAYVGSANWSGPSLTANREVGIVVRGTPAATLLAWFNRLWAQATPWPAAPPASHAAASPAAAPQTPPWIPVGARPATVSRLWGPPLRVGSTTWHGQPETVWTYPWGTVRFVRQRVVAVSRWSP